MGEGEKEHGLEAREVNFVVVFFASHSAGSKIRKEH